MLKFVIFVLCSFGLLREGGAVGSMGPIGKIIINTIYECNDADTPEGDDFKYIVDLVNNDGDKALNVDFENKIPFDRSLNFITDIKKFENGNWKTFYNVKGNVCQSLELYMRTVWGKLVGKLEPKVDQPYAIPPGSYKLDNFQATVSDLDFKSIFYGTLMLKGRITDKSGKIVFCVVGEGVSQSPF